MHTMDFANKPLMQLLCENGVVFTRLACFGENFQWKLVALKGKYGLMEVFGWVWVLSCTLGAQDLQTTCTKSLFSSKSSVALNVMEL